MMEAIVLTGIVNTAETFTLPEICASIQSYLRGLQIIPQISWLGFCSGMHHLQISAFQNHVQSIEFTTFRLHLTDDQWK